MSEHGGSYSCTPHNTHGTAGGSGLTSVHVSEETIASLGGQVVLNNENTTVSFIFSFLKLYI